MNRSSTIAKQNITVTDRIGYFLAIGLGAGLMPVAPGTAGAVEGVAIFFLLHSLHLGPGSSMLALAVMNVALFATGVWASNCACRVTGLKDPQTVVIDEVSGQVISLTPLVFVSSLSIASVLLGFLLFRFFDILKPYPIRKLEHLSGGFGVMADDVLAGVYAAILVGLAQLLRFI